MLYFNPYWWVTRGVTVTLQFLTQNRNVHVNNSTQSIQELPNKLAIPHNYTYIDNIDATSFKFNDTKTTETSIKLDTQIEEMTDNNFGIKSHEEISPFVQALLDAEKQTNLYNNHGDSNIISDDYVSDFRAKRSINQNQRKDTGEKIVKLNLIKGEFLDLYKPRIIEDLGIETFAARIEMPDSTSEQLSSIHLMKLADHYEINVALRENAEIPNNYLHLRLEMSPKNQPSLVFVNEDGYSFVNSARKLTEAALNQIREIRAPNSIQHYPIGTIFDLEFNGYVGEIFHNSNKVADFPNTQIAFTVYNKYDTYLDVFDWNKFFNRKIANNPQIHVTKDSAYLFNNGKFLNDFSLKSEDIFSQKFLDNQFRIQGQVTCGDRLYNIDQNRTISIANIKMPDGKIIELPFVGVKSPQNNQIEVFLTDKHHIPIDSNYQNLQLTKYLSEVRLTFCDRDGTLLLLHNGYNNKFLGIRGKYLDDNTYEKIHDHLSFIKEPSYMQSYPIETKFQLGTGKGKVKVLHNNRQIGELPDTVVYCEQTHTNPSRQFIYTLHLESGTKTVSHQVNTYFVLDEGKDIALKTYKVGDKDVYIKSDYVGGKEYINKIWETYKPTSDPLGANSRFDSTTKSSAIPSTPEINTPKAPTAEVTSSLISASTTPEVPAISITTKSTSSSTKQPDSTTIASTVKQTPVTSSKLDTTLSHSTYSSTTEPSTTTPSTTTPSTTTKITTTKSTSSSTKQPDSTTIASTVKQTPVTSSKLDTTLSHSTYSSITEPSTTAPSTTAPSTTTKITTTKSTSSGTKQPDSTTIASTIKQTPVTSSKLDTTLSHSTYSSITEPSTTAPSTTTKSTTTKLTPSSTKQPDSTLSTNAEYSKASTEIEVMPETVHSSTIMLPENSSISNNISTLDVANTNRTYNVDIHNNDYTNQSSTFWWSSAVVMASAIATAAMYLFVFSKNKKPNIMQVKVYNTTGNLTESNEEECESSCLINNPQCLDNGVNTVQKNVALNTYITLDVLDELAVELESLLPGVIPHSIQVNGETSNAHDSNA